MSLLAHESDEEEEGLPAWSLPASAGDSIRIRTHWPERVTRDWAWGRSTGKGVRVCVLDSGIELDHPLVGTVQRSVAVVKGVDDDVEVTDDEQGDLCGHGTACAGIIRAIAPDCELTSVRVLGAGYTGSAKVMLAGLAWAIDLAYFRRTMLVASAHNMPVESFPWRFASVISVGSHELDDPVAFFANPSPPVEFFARGLDLDVAWLGGETLRATGNSFATPHIAAICALILSAHPDLTPFELKSVLRLTATNVHG